VTLPAASARLTVSIVIPVKDDARFLTACLHALSTQTVAPLEVIVVDNASSDDSAAVASAAGATVVRETRPGIGAASAAGYNRASGDVIARLDADSIPPVDWVQTITAEFLQRQDVDAFTGSGDFVDGPAALRRPSARAYLGAYFLAAGLALSHPPLFGSNFAMRRSAWLDIRDRVHSSDTMIHDDFDLSYHLGSRHRIRYSPGMRVGISMRPFFDGRGALRMHRGIRTVAIHWPHELPWLRLGKRILRSAPGPLSRLGLRGRMGLAFAADSVNVLGLVSVAVERSVALRSRRPAAGDLRAAWGNAVVGLVGLLAAANAVRLTPDERASDGYSESLRRRSARSVQWGAVANTVGCCLLLAAQLARRQPDRRDFARSIYLLLGGNAISAVYRSLIEEDRQPFLEPAP